MSDSIKKDAINNDSLKKYSNLGRENNGKLTINFVSNSRQSALLSHYDSKSSFVENVNNSGVANRNSESIDNAGNASSVWNARDTNGSHHDRGGFKKYAVPVTSALLLAMLCIVFVANFFYESRANHVDAITQDLNNLVAIFEKIDKACGIIGFDYEKNSINFLNVISFAGSEVGPMNLRYPEKWQGPYVKDNPSFQYKEYQVLKTTSGYFITPGDGVKLPNGKVVGTDIKTDARADIKTLMYQKDAFLVDNQPLATPLLLSSNYFASME